MIFQMQKYVKVGAIPRCLKQIEQPLVGLKPESLACVAERVALLKGTFNLLKLVKIGAVEV